MDARLTSQDDLNLMDSRNCHRRGIAVLAAVLCLGFVSFCQGMKTACAETPPRPVKIIPLLRRMYAAFNRGDFDAAVAPLDANVEWTEPPNFPGGGSYRGPQAVKGYLKQSRERWTEGRSEPERFITAGDRIVVFVHVRFIPKGGNEWHDAKIADVYTVHQGRIVQMNAFADRQKALDWAGAKAAAQER